MIKRHSIIGAVCAGLMLATSGTATAAPSSTSTSTASTPTTGTVTHDDSTSIMGVLYYGDAEKASATNPKKVGDKMLFTFTITNPRDLRFWARPTVGNFDGWDGINFAGNCKETPIDPGQTYTCWTTHTITQEDMDRGYYLSRANWQTHGVYSQRSGGLAGINVPVR